MGLIYAIHPETSCGGQSCEDNGFAPGQPCQSMSKSNSSGASVGDVWDVFDTDASVMCNKSGACAHAV